MEERDERIQLSSIDFRNNGRIDKGVCKRNQGVHWVGWRMEFSFCKSNLGVNEMVECGIVDFTNLSFDAHKLRGVDSLAEIGSKEFDLCDSILEFWGVVGIASNIFNNVVGCTVDDVASKKHPTRVFKIERGLFEDKGTTKRFVDWIESAFVSAEVVEEMDWDVVCGGKF